VQLVQTDDLTDAAYMPELQLVHCGEPEVLAYLPASQSKQTLAFTTEVWPGSQFKHTMAPVWLTNVPDVQLVQTDDPTDAAYVPFKQSSHVDKPVTPANVPDVQL